MKTTPVSLILAFSLSFTIGAHADGPKGESRGNDRPGQSMWEKADADQDGFLTLVEFQTLPRIARLAEEKQIEVFRRLDKNNDGRISREELLEMRRPGGQEQRIRRLMELDVNGSGGVSIEEFRAGEMFANMAPDRVEALFRRLDTDGDGEITPKDQPELPARGNSKQGHRIQHLELHRRIFMHLDADQSGTLDFEQFRKARGVSSMDEDAQEALFLRLDLDQDKKINFEEFSKAPIREITIPPLRSGENHRRGRPQAAEESK